MITRSVVFRSNFSKFFLKRRFCSCNSTISDNGEVNYHPLKGIRILDLTRIIAGPYCTMVLSDLGADIIKIEQPYIGDESRKWGPPFLPKSKDSTYFLACNRNKKSVCIDLNHGRNIVRELACKCDILVENFIPGKLAKYQLDYKEIEKIAPHLIYCSITGYGSDGPYANRPGYDVIAASLGGLLHITGEQERPPCKVGVAITDIATGLYAHGAILAALLQFQKTGRGQKIDVNLFSTQVALLINVASSYLNNGIEPKRWGTAHSNIVPYQSFKTADGYLTLCTGSDNQFNALCDLLNINDICMNEKFKTNEARVANRNELVAKLSSIFLKKTSADWMQLFQNSPFPVGPVNNLKEVFNDEHIKKIGLVKTLQHDVDGLIKVVGPPVVYSKSLNDARTAPPIIGAHTEEVLRDILNYSSIQIDHLKSQKIIN